MKSVTLQVFFCDRICLAKINKIIGRSKLSSRADYIDAFMRL